MTPAPPEHEAIDDASDDASDDARMQRLIREHGAMLARTGWGYAENAHDHADLMQEILLAVWRALPRFRGEASERTFVLRIAHNRGVTFATARRPTEGLSEAGDLADPNPSAEARLIHEQRRQRLVDAIRKLDEPHRQAIMLQLEGLSLREIGEVQGITETNAGVRLTRARAALRAFLGGIEE
jgi:RNA polymerase sigma factor (sigma-70 family)